MPLLDQNELARDNTRRLNLSKARSYDAFEAIDRTPRRAQESEVLREAATCLTIEEPLRDDSSDN
jgi:hypothetical protein